MVHSAPRTLQIIRSLQFCALLLYLKTVYKHLYNLHVNNNKTNIVECVATRVLRIIRAVCTSLRLRRQSAQSIELPTMIVASRSGAPTNFTILRYCRTKRGTSSVAPCQASIQHRPTPFKTATTYSLITIPSLLTVFILPFSVISRG